MRRRAIRLAVLVSGGGTTLRNFVEQIESGRLEATVVCVVCSSPAAAQQVKEKLGERLGAVVPQVVERRTFAGVEDFSQQVFAAVRASGAELVCLAGFLSLLSIPAEFRLKVLNVHPALSPAFGGQGMYGRRVHEAVLNYGCKVSGCTVHFADEVYDNGPILVQQCCEVKADDTPTSLAARVFECECEAYPRAVQMIAEGRVVVEGRLAQIRQ